MLPINNQFISQTFYLALGRIHYAQPAQPHKNILQASSWSYLIENTLFWVSSLSCLSSHNKQPIQLQQTLSENWKIVHKITDVVEMYFLGMRIENQLNVKIVIVLYAAKRWSK